MAGGAGNLGPMHVRKRSVRGIVRRRAVSIAGVACVASVVGAPAALGCVEVGVYRDAPSSLRVLDRQVGPGTTVISTYVTINRAVDSAVIALAKQRRAKLMVTVMFDAGRDGPAQPL